MATKTKRYEINPFLTEMDLTVGTKNVKISTIGKDENILVNQSTGEVQGTHVVAFKKVDKDKFVKAFANYTNAPADLNAAATSLDLNSSLIVIGAAVEKKITARGFYFYSASYSQLASDNKGTNVKTTTKTIKPKLAKPPKMLPNKLISAMFTSQYITLKTKTPIKILEWEWLLS